jgi:catechol 2,3-dioxygenase-like lactoylglutathione lyase family enzyme
VKRRFASLVAFAAGLLSLPGTANDQATRPQITGIAYVRLYVSDLQKSRAFYTGVLRLPSSGGPCTGITHPCLAVNANQHIELELVPSPAPQNWVAEIGLATGDVKRMRNYLLGKGVGAGEISTDGGEPAHFTVRDPEGSHLAFLESQAAPDYQPSANQLSTRMLHAGFVVTNQETENRFYMDTLGFRLYWHGGFKDTDIDWYEIQVPDGDNWIEYMLNIDRQANHQELGVQNHFSLGVKDAKAAAAQLRKNGLPTFDGPEVGRDGKNSLDAYDPDGTRVEVMDFLPTQKPCCHPYQAAHPTP